MHLPPIYVTAPAHLYTGYHCDISSYSVKTTAYHAYQLKFIKNR